MTDNVPELRRRLDLGGVAFRAGPSAVFDKARSRRDTDKQRRASTISANAPFGVFRELNHSPAREVVTAKVLGDPYPGRPWPTEEPSSKIPMTFRELEQRR